MSEDAPNKTVDIETKPRHVLVRIIIAILWFLPVMTLINMVVGGFIGGFAGSNTVGMKEGYAAGQNASIAFFAQYGRILYCVDIAVWLGLSIFGLLPGTGRLKKVRRKK